MSDSPLNPKSERSEDTRRKQPHGAGEVHLEGSGCLLGGGAQLSGPDTATCDVCVAAHVLHLIAYSVRSLRLGMLAREYVLLKEIDPSDAHSMRSHLGYWDESYRSVMGILRIAGLCHAPSVVQMCGRLSELAHAISSLASQGRNALKGSPSEREKCIRTASSVMARCVEACGSLYDESLKVSETLMYGGELQPKAPRVVAGDKGE